MFRIRKHLIIERNFGDGAVANAWLPGGSPFLGELRGNYADVFKCGGRRGGSGLAILCATRFASEVLQFLANIIVVFFIGDC